MALAAALLCPTAALAKSEVALEDLQAIFDTNFFGAVRMANAVLPAMRERRRGRIVNVSSLAGLIPRQGEVLLRKPDIADGPAAITVPIAVSRNTGATASWTTCTSISSTSRSGRPMAR